MTTLSGNYSDSLRAGRGLPFGSLAARPAHTNVSVALHRNRGPNGPKRLRLAALPHVRYHTAAGEIVPFFFFLSFSNRLIARHWKYRSVISHTLVLHKATIRRDLPRCNPVPRNPRRAPPSRFSLQRKSNEGKIK